MKNTSDTIHVCIASDDAYAPLITTVIASACTNTKRFIQFWCLETGISAFNKRMIDRMHDQFSHFGIEYLPIDREKVQNFANKISTSGHISSDTYSRLFIPDLFSKMEKLIYLDVDTLVMGDIGTLYDIDLGKYALGAVAADYGVDKTAWFRNLEMDKAHHYFNAGVLLMNPKELCADQFLDRMNNLAEQYGPHIMLGDQDLLNKYFNAQYLELPWRFNLTTRFLELELAHHDPQHRTQMADEYRNCVIRHFESSRKPWNATHNICNGAPIKNMSDFWTVVQMTPYKEWFTVQFNTTKMNLVQGNIWRYLHETQTVFSSYRYKLFGFLPLLTIKHKNKKTKYVLFGGIPLLTCKEKKNGQNRIYKLFGFLTLLGVKRK